MFFILFYFLQRFKQHLTYHRKRVIKLEGFIACFNGEVDLDGEPRLKKGKLSDRVWEKEVDEYRTPAGYV